MSEQPLVSIVIPTYNGSEYLDELIQSVLDQTYRNIELIVIDDGSTDDGKTIEILKKYPTVNWWTRPNKGQYATQNEGFAVAKGEWLTAIGQDDRYNDPGAIAAIIEHARKHPDADVIHGDTLFIEQDGSPRIVQGKQNYPYWVMQYYYFVLHCSVFVKATSLRPLNIHFNESLRHTADVDWVLRLQLAGLKFSRVNRHIGNWRFHPNQVTSQSYKQVTANKARQDEEKRIATLYGPNPLLRFIAQSWRTFDRRKRVLISMLRGAKRKTTEKPD